MWDLSEQVPSSFNLFQKLHTRHTQPNTKIVYPQSAYKKSKILNRYYYLNLYTNHNSNLQLILEYNLLYTFIIPLLNLYSYKSHFNRKE
jgi:hypothetical protein